MHFLESMLQHGTIVFFEHIRTNMDSAICVDAEDVSIEGCVMDPTECQAVGNLREAAFFSIGNNVCGVQKLPMAKGAHTAATLISSDNKFAKSSLVQADLHGPHRVSALNLKLGRECFRNGS